MSSSSSLARVGRASRSAWVLSIAVVAATWGCSSRGYPPEALRLTPGGTGGSAGDVSAAAAAGSGGAAGSSGAAVGGASSVLPSTSGFEESEVVFDQDSLLDIHVTISPEDLEHIEEHGDDELYRPAAVRVVGGAIDESFPMGGLRSPGLRPGETRRRPLVLRMIGRTARNRAGFRRGAVAGPNRVAGNGSWQDAT